MNQEEFIRAVELYTKSNPGVVVIHIRDNIDGSVSINAVPNVAGLIDVKRSGAGLTSGQAYALSGLLHIAKEAREQRNKSASRLILPPGLS